MSADPRPVYEALRRLLDAYYGDRPESMEVAVAAQKIEAWLDAAREEATAVSENCPRGGTHARIAHPGGRCIKCGASAREEPS